MSFDSGNDDESAPESGHEQTIPTVAPAKAPSSCASKAVEAAIAKHLAEVDAAVAVSNLPARRALTLSLSSPKSQPRRQGRCGAGQRSEKGGHRRPLRLDEAGISRPPTGFRVRSKRIR